MTEVFLAADWRHLLMVNFVVDPAILRPFVPRGVELDEWNGHSFVSVVGFRFLRTRVMGLSVPAHRDFDEVNLRFYVRRKRDGQWVRGVVFVKEIVPKRAIAWAARTFYNEHYVRLPMRSDVQVPGRVSYAWRHAGTWASVSADVAGPAYLPAPDSQDAFISEHYWGYVRQRDGGTIEYQVEHPAWRVYRCEMPALVCRAAALYGPVFAEPLGQAPSSAFLAEGSPVKVYRGVRI